jgi:hypothetical protein
MLHSVAAIAAQKTSESEPRLLISKLTYNEKDFHYGKEDLIPALLIGCAQPHALLHKTGIVPILPYGNCEIEAKE